MIWSHDLNMGLVGGHEVEAVPDSCRPALITQAEIICSCPVAETPQTWGQGNSQHIPETLLPRSQTHKSACTQTRESKNVSDVNNGHTSGPGLLLCGQTQPDLNQFPVPVPKQDQNSKNHRTHPKPRLNTDLR